MRLATDLPEWDHIPDTIPEFIKVLFLEILIKNSTEILNEKKIDFIPIIINYPSLQVDCWICWKFDRARKRE